MPRTEIGVMLGVISELSAENKLARVGSRGELAAAAFAEDEETDFAAGRGLARAVLIGVACWIVVGAVVWATLL
jgi:hypothetical protein